MIPKNVHEIAPNERQKIFVSTILSLIILYLGLTYLLTLTPFRFSMFYFQQYLLFRQGYLSALTGTTSFQDIAINLLMLVPIGFLMTLLFKNYAIPNRPAVIAATAIGLLVSLSIETLQIFLPRMTSTIDLINNSVGSCMGAILATRLPIDRTSEFVSKFRLQAQKFLQMWVTLYGLILVAIFLLPSLLNTFRNWDDNFHLLIGNEATRDRPWQGAIYDATIFNRSLNRDEINRVVNQKATKLSMHPLCSFDFSKIPVQNRADSTGASDLHISPPSIVRLNSQKKFISISKNSLLKSRAPLKKQIEQFRRSGEITVIATIAPANLNQAGPARIISLSGDPISRNFTLGQVKNRLNFRVRTPLTGENGSAVSLFSSPVLSANHPQTFAVTFNRGEIRLFQREKLIHPMIYDTSYYLPLLIGIKNNGHLLVEICFFLLFPFAWFSRGLWRRLIPKYVLLPFFILLPFSLSTLLKYFLFHHSPDVILLVIHIIIVLFATLAGMAHDILLLVFSRK
ncbi:hypothetical protein B6D60_01085 [candidate division KSB1 bacterium 4484_87]|nr:MAG: hypothetical protein B6D60_01085 [candidate division KSB1 bacterium 4484_87]